MPRRTPPKRRRTDALSKPRIVEAAIEILDSDGADALSVRSLADRLSTGSGALYHHVADKDELLAAAAAVVITDGLSEIDIDDPREAIRATALSLFDAIDTHPWVGAQLTREPWQIAVAHILDAFGRPLDALGVPEGAQFDCASALVNYVLGLAGQYAGAARLLAGETDRQAFLAAVAERWLRLDAVEYPFVHRIAPELSAHDDREQFIAGIDLVLVGIASLRDPVPEQTA